MMQQVYSQTCGLRPVMEEEATEAAARLSSREAWEEVGVSMLRSVPRHAQVRLGILCMGVRRAGDVQYIFDQVYYSRWGSSMSVRISDFKGLLTLAPPSIESIEGIVELDIPVLAWIGAADIVRRH